MKTISIPEDLHKQLIELKLREGKKNAAELIKKLIFEYREKKFLEASKLFRKKLAESGMTFEQLLKESRKIKEEITNEWYSD